MRIEKVNIYQLAMPCKGEFSISIRKGVQSRIVVVELIGEDQSLRGYGEGIPIKSVTGETPEKCRKRYPSIPGQTLISLGA